MRQEDAPGGMAVIAGMMKKGRTPQFFAVPFLQPILFLNILEKMLDLIFRFIGEFS